MHNTQQEAPGPVSPIEPETMRSLDPSQALDDRASAPPEVVVKLIGVLDEFERLFGDPARA